jgi:thiamine-monophosphate kinase
MRRSSGAEFGHDGQMETGSNATLADVGEFGLIDALLPLFAQGRNVILGPGDDAAVLAVPSGQVVVSTDLLVEGRHFRRDWSAARDIGRKAAAQNLADVMAMGGTGTGLVVGFGAPPELPLSWALELAEGLAEESAVVGASVLGGDVTSADQVMLAVTALGQCQGRPVRRDGARPGDVVALTGRIGWAAAGQAVLGRGFRSPRIVVEAHHRPEPPYAEGPRAAEVGATAMIDVSDGLLADLGHIAQASRVAIDVRTGAFDVAEPLRAVGAALGVDPLGFLLTGGDDHALAAAFPVEAELPAAWQVIGSIAAGEGVTVDGAEYEGSPGHAHFRS